LAAATSSDFCAEISAYLSATLDGVVDEDAQPPPWLQQLIDQYAPQYAGDPVLFRRTIGAVALLAYATSVGRPWAVNLAADPQAVAYGIEGQDPVQGDVVLTVMSGADVFADDIADCAALAEAQLAASPIAGSTVVWEASGLGGHATEVTSTTTLDDIASAGLTYATATESQEAADNGDPVLTQIGLGAWVDRAELTALAQVVRSILLGEAAGGAAGPSVRAVYESMEPAVRSAMRPSGFVGIDVTFHRPKATPSPSRTEAPLTGTWTGMWEIDPPYAGVAGEFSMELVQIGDSFSGTVAITNTDCSDGTVTGTVAGASVTFGWVLTPQPVQFSGTLAGSSMSGTWSALACSDSSISLTGTWAATKR
jgi:hypothetical protein